jgi:hypothetical protein
LVAGSKFGTGIGFHRWNLKHQTEINNRLMKQNTKWLPAVLAVAGGMVMISSAQAQSVTGTPYLSNIDPSTLNTAPNATYANWNGGANFTSLSTGLEVQSAGYGSLYYVVPAGNVQTLNTADTQAVLTFTINSPAANNFVWAGTPFILNDNSGAATYGGYSGSGNGGNPSTVTWNGNVVTWTVPLSAGQLAAVQAGGDAIYSFNLQMDPAVLNNGPIYDMTFNSLVLSPAPEPTTLALVGLGAAGLLAFRRRK